MPSIDAQHFFPHFVRYDQLVEWLSNLVAKGKS